MGIQFLFVCVSDAPDDANIQLEPNNAQFRVFFSVDLFRLPKSVFFQPESMHLRSLFDNRLMRAYSEIDYWTHFQELFMNLCFENTKNPEPCISWPNLFQ